MTEAHRAAERSRPGEGSIVAVGFVPSAPLLVPRVAAGSAALDEGLRDACRSVARGLVEVDPALIVVAAGGPSAGRWDDGHTWGFEGFGVRRDPLDPRPRLPWPLGIGGWLLDDVGWAGAREYVGVTRPDGPLVDAGQGRIGVLVVGDGTARRTEKAPGHLDPRAEAYDAEIARCLRSGDAAGLAGLDEDLGESLMVGGLAVWRWVATVLTGRSVTSADLLAETAPYGVGYFAALWRLDP